MAIVYGLRDKNSATYFYVGSTKYTTAHRLRQHLDNVRNNRNRNAHFTNKAKQIGVDNIVADVLETVADSQQYDSEERWIRSLTLQGVYLTNLVYNGYEIWSNLGSKYSLRRNWDWALKWYNNYRKGISLMSVNPDNEGIVADVQERLARVMDRLVCVAPQEREMLFDHFE